LTFEEWTNRLSRNVTTNRCVITQKSVVTINEHYGAIPYLVLTTSLVSEQYSNFRLILSTAAVLIHVNSNSQ